MKSAVEFLFRKYMDNKQKLTLSDFVKATEIEEKIIDKLIKRIKDNEKQDWCHLCSVPTATRYLLHNGIL